MIPEQKTKMEREAESFAAFDTTAHTATGSYLVAKRGYIAAAKSILDNPGEWGLTENKNLHDTLKSTVVESENKDRRINLMTAKIEGLKSQLTKYREALEQLKDLHSNHEFTCILIDEALKQEEQ